MFKEFNFIHVITLLFLDNEKQQIVFISNVSYLAYLDKFPFALIYLLFQICCNKYLNLWIYCLNLHLLNIHPCDILVPRPGIFLLFVHVDENIVQISCLNTNY